jgi:aquaporin Z
MEFMEMGFYLFLTCVFATLFQHPASPVRHLIPNDAVRRACFGISIGATIVAIVSTPWGRQSGGHLNPAMTFEFYRLGKVKLCDAIFYGIAQFAGATAGVAVATSFLLVRRVTLRFGTPQHSPEVYGAGVAFIAEVVIPFVLMLTVLFASNHSVVSRCTSYFVAALYAIFITLETALCGMSMNPARTFGSAFRGRYWHALWVYFLDPDFGHVGRCRILS